MPHPTAVALANHVRRVVDWWPSQLFGSPAGRLLSLSFVPYVPRVVLHALLPGLLGLHALLHRLLGLHALLPGLHGLHALLPGLLRLACDRHCRPCRCLNVSWATTFIVQILDVGVQLYEVD